MILLIKKTEWLFTNCLKAAWSFAIDNRLVALFIILALLKNVPSTAQLPWTEDFSNNNNQGVYGSCGAAATSCTYYGAPTEGTLSGNFNSLANSNDWFYIYDLGSPYGFGLEAHDVENEVCYTTNTITLSSATSINLEVDIVEWGNLENDDYIRVSLIIDGVESAVQTVSNDFGIYTIQTSNVAVSSTIAVKLCFDTDNNNEYLAVNEIRITENCTLPVASCQNISVDLDVRGSATIVPADIDNGSTAACGLDYMTLSQSSFDLSNVGDNTVTLTIFDVYGNPDLCTATVTVNELDTDGDGIPNSVDIDDDNDGILDVNEQSACTNTQSLSYEFYNATPSGNTVNNIPTTGATATGSVSNFNVDALWSAITPSDDNSFAIRYTGYISINTNETYTFYTTSDDGSKLFIEGVQVVNNDGDHPLQEQSGVIALTSGTYAITILFYENGGGQGLSVSYSSPSIAKTAIPFTVLSEANTPCDSDGDGIPNSLDLDTDNDGILDIIEAGGVDANNDGRVDSTTDTDNDGWANTFDSDNGGTALADPDTDGDGYENRIDIDSDDDGIVDVIEAQASGALISSSGTDTDGDGIDDAFDTDNGGTYITPINTDGADNPDYTDTDTDNDGDLDALEGWDTDNDGTANTLPSGTDTDGDGLDGNYDDIVGPNATTNVTNGGQSSSSFPDLDGETAELDWREGQTDTDGDGVPDITDLDDDNDGILDYDECPTLDQFDFALSGGGTFTTTFAEGPGRFIADILLLDNSFNISVNGVDVAGEIQFQLPMTMDNITTFVDGSAYGDGTVPNIWTLTGTPTNPLLRLIIDNVGNVSLYGAKASGGPLYPMEFTTPPITVAWNPTSLNSVVLGQMVIGPTNMTGSTRYLDFPCDIDNDGLDNHLDIDSDGDGCYDTTEENIADPDDDGIAGTGTPTVDANGLVTAITYSTPANGYFQSDNFVSDACDTDGDNINPDFDLDDDNDGILDLTEQDCGIIPPGSTGAVTEVLGGTSVTTIYTNFGDFWRSSVGAISPTRPNTSHELLAFTTGGVTYTTGVPDDDLYDTDSNGLYELIDTDNDGLGDLAATEMRWQAFSNLNEISNKLSLEGDMNDGDPINALGLTVLNPATEPLNGLLTNGVQGLDLGTGIANINESWYYNVDIISASAVGDGVPDLLITQVADPSSTAFQTITFYGPGWSPIGNAVRVQSIGTGPLSFQVATYELDIYNGSGGVWQANTTRPIRMAALELSEFGIAPADIGLVVSMKIELASSADVAFVGYNTSTFSGLCADVDTDGDGIPNRLDLDSDNDGIWDAIEAGHGEAVTAGVITGPVGLNGVDDNVETSIDSGTLNYGLNDSDADGKDDYLETDSDDDGCNDTAEALVSDTDQDGIAGTGVPTVNASGLVSGITYTLPPQLNWQNAAITIGCSCPQVIINRHITFKTNNN